MAGIVPRLQAAVLGLPAVSGNERVKYLLGHPAGPFTSACGDARVAAQL